MLLAIYRLVVFLAAIAVGGLSVWNLWAMYNSGWTPWRTEEARGILIGEHDESDQFTTTRPGSVNIIENWSVDEDTGAQTAKAVISIVPVHIQDKGVDLPRTYGGSFVVGSNQRPARRRPNGMPSRLCPEAYTSNVLVYYHETNETVPIFDGEQIAILQYAMPYGAQPAETFLLIDFVSSDTDKDGLLTCNDVRSLAVFDIAARELSLIDLDGGEPIWDAFPHSNRTMVVGVGVDENGDGLHDRTHERVRIAVFNPEKKALDYLTP